MSDDPQSTAPIAGRVVAGRYRLGARRGSSVDAALFEAVDTTLGRPVVVKLVHPDISARPDVQADFRAAMEKAGGIHHPNIAQAHAWGITERDGERVLYVVSEQLTGGSLRDMLDRGRLLSPSQALLVGLDACKALDVLHKRGINHGDVRPSTLVFGDDRRLRLVDPGLSMVLNQAAGGPSHRSIDIAKYSSPEQAFGGPLQAKSDVYSLCLTLFETLTGSVPFVGDSTVATLQNRVDKLLPVSADLGALASVLERAGRPDPSDRFTAGEFGRALVQSAERLPRPEPLPILANSLFGADPGTPGEAVDPTGPLSTARIPVIQPAEGAPISPVAPPVLSAVSEDLPTMAVPATVAVAAAAAPAPAGAAADATTLLPAAEVVDPADEFPEAPPHPGSLRKWLIALLLLMAVGGGALAWYLSKPEQRTVPQLAGMEQGVALNAIAGDFNGVTSQEASETVAVGVVIRSSPAAGTTVDKDSTVTLYVSSGPAPRVLPELSGMTITQAKATLQQLGLTVDVADPEFSETVAKDVVLSWTVPDSPTLVAGGTVTKGTAVRLVASAGPAPRPVPDLTGQTLDAATTAITDLQLVMAQGPDEYSDTIAAGQVMRQDPAPGTEVERGATVTVVLSKGHAPIVVPAFTTVNPDEIKALLEQAGFVWGGVEGDPTKAFIGLRVNGAPAITGQEFPFQTTITAAYATA